MSDEKQTAKVLLLSIGSDIFRTIARQSIKSTPPDSSPVLQCARASPGVSGGGEKYNAKIISALARHSRGKSAHLTLLTLSG